MYLNQYYVGIKIHMNLASIVKTKFLFHENILKNRQVNNQK